MDEKRFMALPLTERLACVRADGEYLGSRAHGGHRVHLYRMEGFFCEVWMRLGLSCVEWIEVARNQDVLTEYVHLDIGHFFGDR
ncbi:MAG: hypothetical protein KIT10_03245 [Flavobacteriales bacterium]|nr:hypothetical protein [Flavobacteriales bacterium]